MDDRFSAIEAMLLKLTERQPAIPARPEINQDDEEEEEGGTTESLNNSDAEDDEDDNDRVQKRQRTEEVTNEVNILDDEEGEEEPGSRKNPHHLGPMDKFARQINPNATMRQPVINEALFKERSHHVHQYLARWLYESGIAFNAIDNDTFKQFCEALGQFGPGYRPPSQYLLREPLLKEEVERTKNLLKKQEEEWKVNGCSIVTNGWSDRKRRSVINLCVNCKEGTTFVSSREDSESSHTGKYIFEYVDKHIDDIGPQNVVQVVTDNATNNMAAAELLKVKEPSIFWTSCATHTLNLMLEGIGKQPKFKGVIEKAKNLTIFIYAHTTTLALMRSHTKSREIIRPGVTRFATAFLTLQSINEKKEKLRLLFTSETWRKNKGYKSVKGKTSMATVLSISFWNGVASCLKVFEPLVKVLRLVDGDKKPAMGFIYGELIQAREDIKAAYNNVETNYRPILAIMDEKSRGRLDTPLHLAGYLLNPYYFYKDSNIQNDDVVMGGFVACVERLYNFDTQDVIVNMEIGKYLRKEGAFGKQLAINGCAKNNEKFDPVHWWGMYGNGVPNLKAMASKILSLTTSSSGCERNWSTFEGVHTKKRNRLESTRLNNLVYVQFNNKLLNKKKRAKEVDVDVLSAKDASNAQGWMVEGGDEEETWEAIGEACEADSALEHRRSGRNAEVREVRELGEDDFESDDESEEENVIFDFESDGEGERVIIGLEDELV